MQNTWLRRARDTPPEAAFEWPSLPEESKRTVPDTGKRKKRGEMEWRSSWGREVGREETAAKERN